MQQETDSGRDELIVPVFGVRQATTSQCFEAAQPALEAFDCLVGLLRLAAIVEDSGLSLGSVALLAHSKFSGLLERKLDYESLGLLVVVGVSRVFVWTLVRVVHYEDKIRKEKKCCMTLKVLKFAEYL